MSTTREDPSKPASGGSFRFSAGQDGNDNSENPNLANFINVIRDTLQKSVKPVTVRKELEGKYDQSKTIFSSNTYGVDQLNGVDLKGYRRLSDQDQVEISQVDPYISAIISTRCSQGAACSQPSESKFDKGCRIIEIAPIKRQDFDSDEEFKKEQAIRRAEMKAIMSWVQTCGTDDRDVLDAAFANADPTFKRCTLRQYTEAQIRNLLTMGRAHTQKMKNSDNITVMFRPAPTDTIYNAHQGSNISLTSGENTAEQSVRDAKEYNAIPENEKPTAFVQQVEGQNVALFTEEQMSVTYWQKQALFGLKGYPLSPIELAIYMVFIHQNTLGYLRNQFVKGLASKGIVTLESTNPAVEFGDADLDKFRQEFNNFVMRNDNSAVVPVISGPVKVGYVSLNPTVKDMEFLQVEDHVIRSLCSSYQISPQEMGYGHLGLPSGGLTQANKQQDIVSGEERGLRYLLDLVFETINEVIFENFPAAKAKYKLTYTGVGDDTRDAVIGRNAAELATTATMSSLWAASERTDPFPYGGDAPLAAQFNTYIVPKMKMGIFLEKFFGEENASEKPEYDFFIDPGINQMYQSLKVKPIEQQQEESQAQTEMTMAQVQQAMNPPTQEQPQEGQEESLQESRRLKDAYLNSETLAKSIGGYFGAWVNLHNKDN